MVELFVGLLRDLLFADFQLKYFLRATSGITLAIFTCSISYVYVEINDGAVSILLYISAVFRA